MQTRRLDPFVAGCWRSGGTEAAVLSHALTGAPHAVTSFDRRDLDDAIETARGAGRIHLQAMTLRSRAVMIKRLARRIESALDPVAREGLAAGIIARDGALDIGLALSGMAAGASKAASFLPDTNILVQDEQARRGRCSQQVYVPRRGITLHLGSAAATTGTFLARLAPALIAGTPIILRPADDTAFVADALLRCIDASGILPEGVLQLVYAPIEDLLDALAKGDMVCGTISETEARRVRQHRAVASGKVDTFIDEPGLTAAVLAPGLTSGTSGYMRFLQDVASEYRLQSGQRADALRRIFVPRAIEDLFAHDLQHALADLRIGLPDDPQADFSALVSDRHRRIVCNSITRLSTDCTPIIKPSKTPRLVSGRAEIGAFLGPVLLYCEKPESATSVQSVCAEGPVVTLMGYDELGAAAEIAAASRKPWGCDLYLDDPAQAQDALPGLAAARMGVRLHDGRAGASTTGLPARMHEDGARCTAITCIRERIAAFMSQCIVEGSPQLVTDITGRWIDGARTRSEAVHPFRKPLGALAVGDSLTTAERTITEADVEHFAAFSGDNFYAHLDDEAVRSHPFFQKRVAHGQLVVAFANGLLVDPDPGPVLANLGSDNLRFDAPVHFGERLHVDMVCKQIVLRCEADFGEVRWDCRVKNQDGRIVARYELMTLVAKAWPPAKPSSQTL